VLATGTAGGILVGTDTGGVWSISSAGLALALSDEDWDNPDVNCLAFGPDDPNHFYAGCKWKGSLFESEPATVFLGFIKWHPVPLVDSTGEVVNTGAINRITVLKNSRKIVLACDQGLFWADIPTTGGNLGFNRAQGSLTGRYEGSAPGPNNSVIAAASGDGGSNIGLYRGDWSTGALVMEFAPITGLTGIADTIAQPTEARKMFRTSVASCESQPNIMYAVAARGLKDSWMYGVFKSVDGGKSWQRLTTQAQALTGTPTPPNTPLESAHPNDAGGQGEYNNCIAVSPIDPNFVAIGWRNGPWLSRDGGVNWERRHNDTDNNHLHADVHAVYFDPRDNTGKTMFVCSDGGVVMTPDLGETYVSVYNTQLSNLQFQSQVRPLYGTFDASRQTAGLLAGSLQDIGNVSCRLEPVPKPWTLLLGGDGQLSLFLASGDLIWYPNDWSSADPIGVRSSRWDGSQFPPYEVIPVSVPKSGSNFPNGLLNAVVGVVNSPDFRNPTTHQQMYAVGSPSGSNDVYGLFADDDGGNKHWDYIGSVLIDVTKSKITALGSRAGHNIFVGTNDGRIFAMGPTGSALELLVAPQATNPGMR
jgi:hypothetical protein